MSDALPEVLDAKEVARLLRVNPATLSANLDDMVKAGFPAPRCIGRVRRWSRNSILAWLDGHAEKRATSRPPKLDPMAVIDAL